MQHFDVPGVQLKTNEEALHLHSTLEIKNLLCFSEEKDAINQISESMTDTPREISHAFSLDSVLPLRFDPAWVTTAPLATT